VARLQRSKPIEKWLPLKSFHKAYKGARRRAGLDTGGRRRWVHDVRARFITEVSKITKSGSIVQRAARHSSFETTQCYIEIGQEEMRDAIEAADARRPERAGNTDRNIAETKSRTGVPDAAATPRIVSGGKT
jgi:hypothetical protein